MTEPEDLVRSTTRAIASTVREVPPLRLDPAEGRVLPFAPVGGRARRLRGWLAPVTAAAVVLAVAASLVIMRGIPNGRVVPAASPAPSSSVPAFYASLSATGNDLVVGGTFTGKRVATVPAPKGTVFGVVTAAADDRTFIVDAVPASGADGAGDATWYQFTISPGSSPFATELARLPIPATPVSLIGAAAVSASGSELGVMLQPFHRMTQPGATTTTLRIYSVATGRLLHSWSTSYQYVLAGVGPGTGTTRNNSLSWVDDDRAVAFETYQLIRKTPTSESVVTTMRLIDVSAAGSNLISDSRAVSPGCPGVQLAQAPPLTADGRTVPCVQVNSSMVRIKPGQYRNTRVLTWSARSVSAPAAPRTLYQTTVRSLVTDGSQSEMEVGWANASGSAMIVDWAVGPLTSPLKPHFGVVSAGRFVPLPTPVAGMGGFEFSSDIAW